MNKVNKLYVKLPYKCREKLLFIVSLFNLKKSIGMLRNIREYYKKSNIHNWGEYDNEKDIWKKSFKKLSIITKDGIDIAKRFYMENIEIIKQSNIDKESPILICLVKDDIKRIKTFFNHYRKMGVSNFAIIDNCSEDGTYEFLKEQKEINLFKIKETYTTLNRQAWVNRIISYYGFNKWYLIVDSDELFVYENCENYNIKKILNYLEEKQIYRNRSLMIDMYSKGPFMRETIDKEYTDIFKYFDVDSYDIKRHKFFECVTGGMRKRIVKEDANFSPFLIKYPLIFFEKGDIQYNSHYSFPFYKNFGKPLGTALLHYKFLPNDLDKIKKIVEQGNFTSGSKEYMKYLEIYENKDKSNFLYEGSKEYINSSDIYKINLVQKLN